MKKKVEKELGERKEFVVNQKSGEVRQAGSDRSGVWIEKMREEMSRNLFYFAYATLNLTRLTESLHLPVCKWLVQSPPYRKLLLLPRDHLKTSLLRALVCHMLVQEKEENIYFPGMDGSETRILYAGETATNAEHQLSWIEGQMEGNALLRTFWPHKTWGNTKKEAKRWNAKEMLLPRKTDYPEASVETIGVGGAVTGRHYNVLAKDDLIGFAARKSPVVMQEASEWHKTSRALLDDPDEGLEFLTGTHWATGDIYDEMEAGDPSIEVITRAAVEEGKPIFPEMFSLESIARLERELGELFPLLYMNTSVDPRLTDFKMEDVRGYEKQGEWMVFAEDARDGKRGVKKEEVQEEVPMLVQEAARKGLLRKGMRVVRV